MFRLLVKVPLHLDSVSAGLADQRVSPAETSKGVVGKLIPAGIALDGDIFHAPIVEHRGAGARIKWKNPIVVSACPARVYARGAAPAKMAGSSYVTITQCSSSAKNPRVCKDNSKVCTDPFHFTSSSITKIFSSGPYHQG